MNNDSTVSIAMLDRTMQGIVVRHSVYGVECVINSLVRAIHGKPYLDRDAIIRMLDHALENEKEDRLNAAN